MVRMSLGPVMLVGVLSVALGAQEVITVRSGNGTVGGPDALVTMLVGPVNAAFGTPFTAASFSGALLGPPAQIVTPAAGWITPLPAAPLAQWIATSTLSSAQGSALYAIPFTVQTAAISAASLDLIFATDDNLGDVVNEGAFVNGVSAANTRAYSAYYYQTILSNLDVSAGIHPGTNVLFVYQVDTAGAGGVIFEATIRVHTTARLHLGLPLVRGQIGMVEILASTWPGHPFLIVPGILPPASPGLGIPLGNGTEFRLSLTDPLLGFALFDPLAAMVFPSLTGTVSPLVGRGAILVFVPNDPGLQGLLFNWQGVILSGGPGPSGPVEATDVISSPVL